MSLQIWLPLNGSTVNYGLDSRYDTPQANSFPVWANEGKTGSQSLNPTTTTSGVLSYTNTLSNQHDYTISCWIKVTDNTSGSRYVIYSGNDNNGYGLGISLSSIGSSTFKVQFRCFGANIFSENLSYSTWYHIAMVVDYTNLKFSGYVDGVLVQEKTYTQLEIRDYGFNVGWLRPSYYPLKGLITDVRVYDNCLSPKEIKEVSKGLILHYKMDDQYIEDTTNLFSDLTLVWIGLGANASSSKSGDIYTVTVGELRGSNTVITSRMNMPLSILENGAQYAVSFKYRVISGNGLINIASSDWCDKLFTSTSDIVVGDYHYIKCVCPIRNTYDSTIRFFDFTFTDVNTVYEISEMQLEKKDHVTPYVDGSRQNQSEQSNIRDCSGYCNDGTITGSLSVVPGSARYNHSTSFTGNQCVIKDSGIGEVRTMSAWVKTSKNKNTSQMICADSASRMCLSFYSGNIITYMGYGGQGAGSRCLLGNSYIENEWNHLVSVYTGSGTRDVYCNGVKLDTNGTDYWITYPSSGVYIGSRQNLGLPFFGEMSDIRMYTTALSESDILELYNTSAIIDNAYNMHSFEFVEESIQSPEILKNGEVVSESFLETHPYLYLPAGDAVNTELYYDYGDECKAVTVIKYSGGSGRDLMGYSPSGNGYWGVTATDTWEKVTSTNSDISVRNTVVYQKTSQNQNQKGTYYVGQIGNSSSWSVRNKYIYNVKLYKNGVLERDLWPLEQNSVCGLYDILNGIFYPATGSVSGIEVGYEDTNASRIYKNHILAKEFIEM